MAFKSKSYVNSGLQVDIIYIVCNYVKGSLFLVKSIQNEATILRNDARYI